MFRYRSGPSANMVVSTAGHYPLIVSQLGFLSKLSISDSYSNSIGAAGRLGCSI